MSDRAGEPRSDEAVRALVDRMIERLGPRSPGMGNPPCYLWEVATAEGVAIVMAHVALRALRALPVEQRMEAMGMRSSGAQWFCSSRCWQEGGPHDEACRSEVHYVEAANG